MRKNLARKDFNHKRQSNDEEKSKIDKEYLGLQSRVEHDVAIGVDGKRVSVWSQLQENSMHMSALKSREKQGRLSALRKDSHKW